MWQSAAVFDGVSTVRAGLENRGVTAVQVVGIVATEYAHVTPFSLSANQLVTVAGWYWFVNPGRVRPGPVS
ncbi:MAG: hypothetical protein ABWZ02_12665 [Nakamurella sp.]